MTARVAGKGLGRQDGKQLMNNINGSMLPEYAADSAARGIPTPFAEPMRNVYVMSCTIGRALISSRTC